MNLVSELLPLGDKQTQDELAKEKEIKMKTERELFEVEMEKLIGKVLSIKYSEEEGGYVAHKLMMSDESTKMLVNIFNFSWAMWQASAQREGYKLVPVNPTDEMINTYRDKSIAPISTLSVIGYKAMIGAVNNDH